MLVKSLVKRSARGDWQRMRRTRITAFTFFPFAVAFMLMLVLKQTLPALSITAVIQTVPFRSGMCSGKLKSAYLQKWTLRKEQNSRLTTSCCPKINGFYSCVSEHHQELSRAILRLCGRMLSSVCMCACGFTSHQHLTAVPMSIHTTLDSLGSANKTVCHCGGDNCRGFIQKSSGGGKKLKNVVKDKSTTKKPKRAKKPKIAKGKKELKQVEVIESNDASDDVCAVCGLEGTLICCDFKDCPLVYHVGCLEGDRSAVDPMAVDVWHCPRHK
eukprot:m.187634 g.187634  ORF g.187634 m.187634 type:complete len:271 (+) comp13627_c0_seq3:2966-3778(+)